LRIFEKCGDLQCTFDAFKVVKKKKKKEKRESYKIALQGHFKIFSHDAHE